MITTAVTFSFDNTPEGLRLNQVLQGSVPIPVRPHDAVSGMDTILRILQETNQKAYADAASLDRFEVTLLPHPISKNLGLKIEGKYLQINIAKLKAETSAVLLSSLPLSSRNLLLQIPDAPPQPPIPDRMSREEEDRLSTEQTEAYIKLLEQAGIPLPGQEENVAEKAKQAVTPKPSIIMPPSQPEVFYYEKLTLPPAAKKCSGCVLLDREPPKADLSPATAPVAVAASPVLPAASSQTVEQKDRRESAAAKPAQTNSIVSQESDQAERVIKSLMKTQFISTNIQRSAESKEEVFSDYLMERIFGRIESAAMNNETGAFTLTFAEEQKISLKNLPKGKSQAVLGALKPAVGKTLHVAKEVKGKFNYLDEGRPSFEDGSLTIQWQRMWLNFTAHLTGIFTQDQDPELLIVAGKIAFLTEKRAIRAQDFVDFLECNMPK
jgi:hypothetical protein